MMHKLFLSYGPRAEKTLDETLIMKPRDFKMNFLHSVWKELIRIVTIIREADVPRTALKLALETINECRTMIKDLFRYFKDIYPIVMSDTISKNEYNLLHEQYKLINLEIEAIGEFLQLYLSNSGCKSNTNDDMMIAQIDNQLRDVLHATLTI